MLESLGKYQGWAPVILRLFLGIAFIVAGVGKFLSLDMVAGMFTGWFGSMGMTMAIVIAVLELLGGLGLLLGVWTRLSAIVLAIIMLGAVILTWHVEPQGLFGTLSQILLMNAKSNMVVALAYFFILFAIALRGADKWALLPDAR